MAESIIWTLPAVVPIQRRNPVQREVDPIDKLKDSIKEGAAKAFNSLHPAGEAPWAPIGLGEFLDFIGFLKLTQPAALLFCTTHIHKLFIVLTKLYNHICIFILYEGDNKNVSHM
jgi:hypothetical protein